MNPNGVQIIQPRVARYELPWVRRPWIIFLLPSDGRRWPPDEGRREKRHSTKLMTKALILRPLKLFRVRWPTRCANRYETQNVPLCGTDPYAVCVPQRGSNHPAQGCSVRATLGTASMDYFPSPIGWEKVPAGRMRAVGKNVIQRRTSRGKSCTMMERASCPLNPASRRISRAPEPNLILATKESVSCPPFPVHFDFAM